MAKKGTIQFLGDRGNPSGSPHVAKTVVNGISDMAALEVLAPLLADRSDGVLYRVSLSEEQIDSPSEPGTDANIDVRGVIVARNKDTGATHKWEIPAWDGTVNEEADGDRLDSVEIATIVSKITTNTEAEYEPLYGYLKQVR